MKKLEQQIKDARKNVNAIKRATSEKSMRETFLDCGANVGEVSLAASEFFGRVIAIEAHPDTAKVARSRLKKAHNVEVVTAAVSARSGEEVFVSSPSHCAIGATARSKMRLRKTGYYKKVKTVGFADLLKEYQPTVVKMDIEGSEFEALADIHLPKKLRYMIVEFHSGPEKIAPIMKAIKAQGFSAKGFQAETTWKMQTIEFERKTA